MACSSLAAVTGTLRILHLLLYTSHNVFRSKLIPKRFFFGGDGIHALLTSLSNAACRVVLGYFAAAALVWIAAGSWVASSGNKLEQLEQGSRPGHGGRGSAKDERQNLIAGSSSP